MKDSTILALGVISVVGVMAVAFILRKRDRGTMLLRDELGNITAILPMDSYFIDQRHPAQAPAAVLRNEFTNQFAEHNR